MRKSKEREVNIFTQILIIVIGMGILFLFVYFLIALSFQEGEASGAITIRLSSYITRIIFDEATSNQVEMMNRVLRFGAHLGLFFLLGIILCYVSMLIFRGYFRVIGVMGTAVVCYLLAYYTEYYKQFIANRHFQIEDVKLNWIGSIIGIGFMVTSYFMNKLLVRLNR